jgi:peptidoglycan/LPS O-acetylase OafA/YrhL
MRSNNRLCIANVSPTRFFRGLSTVLFVSALAAMLALLVFDALNTLAPTPAHRGTGAFSLILIGSSYVALQISLRRPRAEKLKAILLGIAFSLWGAGQLLPPGHFATATDTAVMVIFVVDLSLIIIEHLKRNQYE